MSEKKKQRVIGVKEEMQLKARKNNAEPIPAFRLKQ
jgi:hypothetical protein